jgi:DNA-directed RNA polymerase specialized sigma24 family protein
MPDNPSITQWLQGVQAGDQDAAQQLWARYFQKLVRLACNKLPSHMCREFDEEDIALSAFRSFFAGVEEQRFPQLNDRNDLWRLLVVITRRKATAYVRRATRQKRGGGEVQGESEVAPADVDDTDCGLDALVSEEPTPAFAAEAAEEYHRLLSCLGDESFRTIAVLKMQGYTVEEIAARTSSTRRTIERRLQIIRKKWLGAVGAENNP